MGNQPIQHIMELDRISKHVLVKLTQFEEATASDLKDALGLEQNQSIHYRMDEKLIPENLVYEHPERREQPGSRKAARVYQITETGEDWVDEHGHEITLSDLDEAEEEIQRITAELRSISTDLQKLKRWRQEQSGHSGGVSTRLNNIGERVDDLEALMEKHERRDYSEIWDRLHDLNEQTEQLDERVNDTVTADDIEQVEENLKDISNRVETLATNLDSIKETQDDWSEWGNRADRRLQRLEQHASQGFLGRLRWLLFG